MFLRSEMVSSKQKTNGITISQMNHFYEILIYCCIAYKEKSLHCFTSQRLFSEELKILKKYNEYAFTAANL